jgi:hypothetical protein
MVIAAINIAVVYLFMPETLLESERKPFKLKLPNPFEGPLELLRLKVSHEPKDACGDADEGVVKGRDEGLAGMMTVLLMRVISQLADVRAVNQTQAMYKVHYLRWSIADRASFVPTAGLVALPGYLFVGSALQLLGVTNSLRIGAVGHAIQTALWTLSDQGWHFYSLLPFGWLRPQEGPAAGPRISPRR